VKQKKTNILHAVKFTNYHTWIKFLTYSVLSATAEAVQSKRPTRFLVLGSKHATWPYDIKNILSFCFISLFWEQHVFHNGLLFQKKTLEYLESVFLHAEQPSYSITTSWKYDITHIHLHCVRKKWNNYYFRHNLDKQKYTVVIFA